VIPVFDAFIAIDWSGAKGNYTGIAVAMCRPGRAAPRLIHPAGGSPWKRRAIADWLVRQLSGRERLLIGLDFGFGLPFENDRGYLGGRAPGLRDIFSLWSHLDARSSKDSDFGCTSFINDPEYASLFWKSGRQPKRWVGRKRQTEHACAASTKTRPDTLYKLLGSKQVGKASITGIRVLHRVRALVGERVSVWPFEPVRTSAFVEIYPTLFRKAGLGSISKLRSFDALNKALKTLRSNPPSNGIWTDHETDALVSAAGLRFFAGDPNIWSRADLLLPQVQREGWIFGA